MALQIILLIPIWWIIHTSSLGLNEFTIGQFHCSHETYTTTSNSMPKSTPPRSVRTTKRESLVLEFHVLCQPVCGMFEVLAASFKVSNPLKWAHWTVFCPGLSMSILWVFTSMLFTKRATVHLTFQVLCYCAQNYKYQGKGIRDKTSWIDNVNCQQ